MIFNTKIFKGFLIIFYLILNFIFLYSCKQEKLWKGTIKKENGVVIIKNPVEPKYERNIFHIEEELTIGKKDGEEEYIFSYLRGIVVDNTENIYVLDQKLSHINVYKKNGKYKQTIGKKGQGPGELSSPLSIHITNDKELFICDSGNRRLSYYSLDGKFIKHVHIKIGGFHMIECIDSQTNIFSLVINPISMNLELNKYNKNFKLLKFFGTCSIPDSRNFNPFSPKYSVGIRNDDYVVTGLPSDYKLKNYSSGGKCVKIIKKKYSPVLISEEEIKKEKKRWGERNFNFPKYHNPFSTFSIDSDNRIFVKTYEKPEPGDSDIYDVFDSEGIFIAKVLLKKNYFCLWKGNKLYTIEKDEEGYLYVKRYKAEWTYL